MPATSIRDLVVHDDDVVVGTHGRSFWILDDITPLRQLDAQVAGAPAHPLQAAGWPTACAGTSIPTRPCRRKSRPGKNPPDGAIIYYYLKANADRAGDPGDLRRDRQAGAPLFERRQAGAGQRKGTRRSDLLDPAAAGSSRQCRHAPLHLGPALPTPRGLATLVSDDGHLPRYAQRPNGAVGAARRIHGQANGQRSEFQPAADRQDGPARQNAGWRAGTPIRAGADEAGRALARRRQP